MPCSYCCTTLNDRPAATSPRHDQYHQDGHQGNHHQHLFSGDAVVARPPSAAGPRCLPPAYPRDQKLAKYF